MSYTYETLKDDIIANMEEDSDEFVSALPSIIARAQNYLQRRIEPIAIVKFTEIPVSSSVRTITLPTDLLVLKSIQVSTSAGNVNLVQQTNEYLTAYWPTYTSVATPKYYAAKDNAEIFVAPTPNTNTNALIEYVPKVSILSSATPTNWFSNYADSALFAASMMFANAWTKNAEVVQTWKAQTDEELMAINNEARRARRSDTVDRSTGTPENNLGDGAR